MEKPDFSGGTMQITKNTNADKFGLDCKRFYLPFTIEDVCPNCKDTCTYPLDSHYLSYPKIGLNTFTCYCEACGHEWKHELELSIEIKAHIP